MERKFHQKTWFIILMLLFFFPVGLYLLWKSSWHSKKTKIYITAGFFIVVALGRITSPHDNNSQQVAVNQKVEQSIKQSDDSKKISKTMNLDAEKANNIESVLKQCGIKEIKEITRDEALDNFENANEKAYRLKIQNNIKNVMVYVGPAGSVYTIRFADKYLYQNNAMLLSVSDFILSTDEEIKLTTASKELVKKTLKSPKSADFPWPDEWYWAKEPGKITVQSYVDAQNSFGAQIRAQFEIVFDTKTNKITSYIFEGKKLI